MLQLLLDYRLDCILFAAISVGMLIVSHRWARLKHGAAGPSAWMWASIGATIGATAIVTELSGQHERQRLISMLQGIAPTYAQELGRLGHENITPDTSPDDSLYASLIEAQIRWLKVNSAVSDIYTFGRRADGQIVLLVDSETDYNHDGKIEGEREQRTKIGELYDEDQEMILRALNGEHLFADQPVTDRWGTWVGAYEPIRGNDGQIVAVLGVDYPADGWNVAICSVRAAAIGLFGIINSILIASSSTLAGMRSELVRRREIEDALRESEKRLAALALRDRLTSLPNRGLLADRVAQAILRSRRKADYKFALFYIDLDGFKGINDRLGHEVGDLLLKAVADRYRLIVRETDTISRCSPGVQDDSDGMMAARLGGDEFVILADDIASDADVERIAARLQAGAVDPFIIQGHNIRVSASIGVACSHAKYQSLEELLRDADTAMYHAKAAGKGAYAIFNSQMRQQAIERLAAEGELKLAIENRQFFLEYQPIVSLDDRRLRGFEALVRWNHPTRGRVAPDQFIPLAEESGLIVPLGTWVIEQACATIARWQRQLPQAAAISISVNISRRQFDSPELPNQIEQILLRTGARPENLKLEITESLISHDPDAAMQVVQRLAQMGLPMIIDDFGLGSSSLGILHRFPVEGLKIDRSFIATASQRRDYAAVVNTIVNLARNLKMTLVAEGVETMEQAAMLQGMGCELAQGYLFAKPLPEAAAMKFIQDPAFNVSAA